MMSLATLIKADESGAEVVRGEQSYIQWKEGRSTAVTQASRSTITVQTATGFTASAFLSEQHLARIQVESVSRVDIGRPSGRRFGALVHAVLATVDLDASTDEITAVAQAHARLIDATAAEVDAAVTTVRSALQHPLMLRAARATALRREVPLQHYRDDGTLIEGVVDLAFQESTPEFNGWKVVDFKTDREIEKAEDRYRAQVATYVEAVRTATGSLARGFLLVV
jgi:ATP-dependent exoDNAse (exonuclease V) beta subunit